MSPNWAYLLRVGLIALLYFVLAEIGLSLAHATRQISAVWPPSGLSLVVLLVLGYRYWPAIYLGALLANLTAGEQWYVAAGIAVGNTLEALVGAFILGRFARFKNELRRPRDLVALAIAGIVCTTVAALIGPAMLALGGNIAWAQYGALALLWWQGDMMGVLLIGPMLLAFLSLRALRILRGRLIEGGVLIASVFAISIMVFAVHGREPTAYPYLLVPFLVWAAVRFTQVGVVTATLIMAITALWATSNGMGPFTREGTFEQDLTQLQLFMVVMASTALFLAMSITARQTAEEALRKQAGKLEKLDTELKEANRRITNILAGILDDGSKRRGT
jgi:two-component system, NarL family, sensor histidine kinase FusK